MNILLKGIILVIAAAGIITYIVFSCIAMRLYAFKIDVENGKIENNTIKSGGHLWYKKEDDGEYVVEGDDDLIIKYDIALILIIIFGVILLIMLIVLLFKLCIEPRLNNNKNGSEDAMYFPLLCGFFFGVIIFGCCMGVKHTT